MLAVAGAIVGAAIGYKTKGKKVNACGNPYCTCGAACGCGAGCQCGKPVSMLGVAGREETLTEKIRNTAFAALVAVGLMSPLAANAVDVKLGSDGGQLVFVPDEVTIKAGDLRHVARKRGHAAQRRLRRGERAGWHEPRCPQPRRYGQREGGEGDVEVRQAGNVRVLLRAPPWCGHGG